MSFGGFQVALPNKGIFAYMPGCLNPELTCREERSLSGQTYPFGLVLLAEYVHERTEKKTDRKVLVAALARL